MRFEGNQRYVATDDLKVAVNAAITLERRCWSRASPHGKTRSGDRDRKGAGRAAHRHRQVATKALRGLYEYDAVSRLRDSQLGDARVQDIRNLHQAGKLWDAFVSDQRPVLLIDEIDKATSNSPTTSCRSSTGWSSSSTRPARPFMARRRPIVSSPRTTRRSCPTPSCAAALPLHPLSRRRHHRAIIEVHFPGIKQRLVAEALRCLRDPRGARREEEAVTSSCSMGSSS